METNDERRKRKLADLCAREGIDAIATAAGLAGPEALDQILKGTLLPIRKSDGTRRPKGLGDDAARKIEEAYGLGRGWFDADDSAWPFQTLDRSRFDRLRPEEQIEIQGVVRERIESFEASRKGKRSSG